MPDSSAPPPQSRTSELAAAANAQREAHDELELVDAWTRWHRSPGDERTARNLHYALQAAADRAGTTPTRLHEHIVSLLRHENLEPADAIPQALADPPR